MNSGRAGEPTTLMIDCRVCTDRPYASPGKRRFASGRQDELHIFNVPMEVRADGVMKTSESFVMNRITVQRPCDRSERGDLHCGEGIRIESKQL